MSLITVAQEVALQVGIKIPTSLVGSTDRTERELLTIATKTARNICQDNGDWRELVKVGVVNGPLTAFPLENWNITVLPTDFHRMTRFAAFLADWMPNTPLMHADDPTAWLHADIQNKVTGAGSAPGVWNIIGNNSLRIMPAFTTGSVYYTYLSNAIAYTAKNLSTNSETWGPVPAFTADSNTFVLDERLLMLGMLWQWKAGKGAAYAEDMAAFEQALANAQGSNKGTMELLRDARSYATMGLSVRTSYPYPIPTSSPYPLT